MYLKHVNKVGKESYLMPEIVAARKEVDESEDIAVQNPKKMISQNTFEKKKFGVLGTGEGRDSPMIIPDDQRYEKHHYVMPNHYEDCLDYILLPRGIVEDRIERLAMDIRNHYGGSQIHILCILKGSRGFFSKLLEYLDRIHRYDISNEFTKAPYMEHYIRLKSYSNTVSLLSQIVSLDSFLNKYRYYYTDFL